MILFYIDYRLCVWWNTQTDSVLTPGDFFSVGKLLNYKKNT